MIVPSTKTVRLSIIVPTFRRADRLERLLLSLEPQLVGRSDRELIAVDDASGDPSYATLACRFGSVMQLLTQPKNAGPSAARNAGFRASRGEFLVFTDDDCVATPYWLDWLDNILIENPDIDLIGGEARPLPHEHGMTVTRWVPDGFLRLKTWSYRDVVTLCSSCNLAVRRNWFERIGGFREAARWAEDRNLTYRLRQAGAIIYTDHAWHMYHESEATLRQHFRRRIGYGCGAFEQMAREQPAIDRTEWPDDSAFAVSFGRRIGAEIRRLPSYRHRASSEKKWWPGYAAMAALTPLAMDWGYLRARQKHNRRKTGLGPTGHSCLVSNGRSGTTVLGDMLSQNPALAWEQEIFTHAALRGTAPVTYDLLPQRLKRCTHRGFGFAIHPTHIAGLGLSMENFIDRATGDGIANYILLVRRNSLRRHLSMRAARLAGRFHEFRSDFWNPTPVKQIHLEVAGKAGRDLLAYFDRLEADYAALRRLLTPHCFIELSYEVDIEPDPTIGLRKVAAFLDLPDFDPVVRYQRFNPHPLPDIVPNYDEVAELIGTSKHGWMLDG